MGKVLIINVLIGIVKLNRFNENCSDLTKFNLKSYKYSEMLQQRKNIFISKDGPLEIRYAHSGDVTALSALCGETFMDTYAAYNTPEDMRNYVQDHFHPDIIKNDLNNEKLKYILAFYNELLAGYCLLEESNVPEAFQNLRAVEISRIYVHKLFQGKKIGGALMHVCIDIAAQNNFDAIWLGVWQQNINAIQFYEHYGFTKQGTKTFVLGTDEQADFMMMKKIT